MGAQTFVAVGKGKTMKEAFASAHEQAAWEHGHGGYTGTIAEKHDAVEFRVPKGVRATTIAECVHALESYWYALEVLAEPQYRDADEVKWATKAKASTERKFGARFPLGLMASAFDKWGAAGAVRVREGEYLFFGLAFS